MSGGFEIHIIGAGRGGTSLLTGLLDAHPECEIHPEEFSTKLLMGREWTDAETKCAPAERISMRIDNFMAACERKAVEFPGKKWGHKTTTEHIQGLEHLHPDSQFISDPNALPAIAGIDALVCFLKRVAHIKTVFILRDGRTCIPSKMRRAGLSLNESIKRWKYSLTVLDALKSTIHDLQVIRFEDLIGDPEPVLRSVCDFLGVAYTQAMLQGTQSNKMVATYRRDGFDRSTIDTTGFSEPWLEEIRQELKKYYEI